MADTTRGAEVAASGRWAGGACARLGTARQRCPRGRMSPDPAAWSTGLVAGTRRSGANWGEELAGRGLRPGVGPDGRPPRRPQGVQTSPTCAGCGAVGAVPVQLAGSSTAAPGCGQIARGPPRVEWVGGHRAELESSRAGALACQSPPSGG